MKEKTIERAFWALLSSTAIILAWVGVNISDKIEAMSSSVIELNTTMKSVIMQIDENKSKLNNNDNLLNELDRRVLILESKQIKGE